MKDRQLSIVNKSIFLVVAALAFLLPTFFLPVTTEYYEFNKIALTVVVSVVLILLWGVKMLLEGKVEITKSPTNKSILLLLAVFAISTYFSISRASSVLGAYGRWSESLILIVTCTLLYFAVTSNIKSKAEIGRIIAAFIGGATLSSVVAAMAYLGIKFGSSAFLQARNFTLTGSSITTTVIAAFAVALSAALIVDIRTPQKKYMFLATAIINVLCIALLGEVIGWVVLLACVITFLAFTPSDKIKPSIRLASILFGVMVVSGITLSVPAIKNALRINVDYPREVRLALNSSWNISTSTIRDFPIFGSGPSTFYLNFSHYRPLFMNNGDQWAIRYDKPYNEFLDVLSTLGVVGFLAFIYFMYKALALAKQTDGTGLNAGMSAVIIGMGVFFLLHYSTGMTTVVMFLFLSLLTSYAEGNFSHSLLGGMVETAVISFSISGKSTNVTTKTVSIMFAIPMFLLAAFGAFIEFRVYAADVWMKSAVDAAGKNNARSLYVDQTKAVGLNPYVNAYHSSLAQTDFVLANSIASSKAPKDLTDSDKTNIQSLIAASIQETRITTELLDPTNPAYWEQRGRIYALLNNAAKDASQWAIASYTRAIQLDPTNPVLRVSLGGVYFTQKDYPNAERHFQASVSLKSDYANGYYNLGQTLIADKKYADALTAMQIAQRLVPKDAPDYKMVSDQVAALSSMPEVAGASTQNPTVNTLTTQPGQTQQQPLTNPSTVQQPTIKESTQSLTPTGK